MTSTDIGKVSEPTVLHLQLDLAEAEQLLYLANRALNTLEPDKWPPIAKQLVASLEKFCAPQYS